MIFQHVFLTASQRKDCNIYVISAHARLELEEMEEN